MSKTPTFPADFETERWCPYHGGFVPLAACPIVATNEEFASELRRRQRNAVRTPAMSSSPEPLSDDFLGRHDEGSKEKGDIDVTNDDVQPMRSPQGRFLPGSDLESLIDGRTRLIVAAPPVRPSEPVKRRFLSGTHDVPYLPSPAELAREFGGQRARPVRACPETSCLHPLPAAIDTRHPVSIAVVGHTGASKTTMIAALIDQLGAVGPQGLGVDEFPPTEGTSRRLREVMKSFRAGAATPGTEPQRFHAPLEFLTALGSDRVPVVVLLHDIAGEDLMEPDRRLRWGPYVLWADVILFVYNPEESPLLNMRGADTDQAAVLNGVLDDIEAGPPFDAAGRARGEPPLVLAVSKADLLPDPPDFATGQSAESVAAALRDLGNGDMVAAANRWQHRHWRFVAPQPTSGKTQGVLELFRLVLSLVES